MQQTSRGSEAAILVSIDLGDADYRESLEELRLLAETAGVRTLATIEGKRIRPNPALFAGSGKIQEVAEMVERMEVPLVIFNHDLSPAQMRNLTAKLNTRVIDRTMLILDIFAQRAQSHEGKVQVELAQLKYLATRLVGLNSDMGQQKFAVGARGPGETQLELDRRKLDKRVHLLKERLGIDKERVTLDASLEDLGIDSLMQIELLFDFEDKYKVKIPDLTEKPTTIDDLIAIVEPFIPKS